MQLVFFCFSSAEVETFQLKLPLIMTWQSTLAENKFIFSSFRKNLASFFTQLYMDGLFEMIPARLTTNRGKVYADYLPHLSWNLFQWYLEFLVKPFKAYWAYFTSSSTARPCLSFRHKNRNAHPWRTSTNEGNERRRKKAQLQVEIRARVL